MLNGKKEVSELKAEITDEFIYDLEAFRGAFIINFNLFKRSWQSCTQGVIEDFFVLPYTFPKAFLNLRFNDRMGILRFFRLFFHEILINIRNMLDEIKIYIICKLKGQKVMKSEDFGALFMKTIEENIDWTQEWYLCKGNLENDFVIAPLEDSEDKEKRK